MGRPKKENIVKTEEEIKREDKLRELEHEVIRQVVIARKSQKLSQRVVGERAGIIRETVAKIENKPTNKYAYKATRAYWLYFGCCTFRKT